MFHGINQLKNKKRFFQRDLSYKVNHLYLVLVLRLIDKKDSDKQPSLHLSFPNRQSDRKE